MLTIWGLFEQVETPKAMFDTDYGLRLTRKIVVFCALLAIAAYNKLTLTPALERADAAATVRLRRTIMVEYGLYIVILAFAVSLTLTSPPRALNAAAATAPGGAAAGSGVKLTAQAPGGYTAEIDVTPAVSGENMFMVTVRDSKGAALKLDSMDMMLALPAASIADVEKKGQAAGPEMWHFMVGETIIPGEWEIKMRAFVNPFDSVDFEAKVPIK